MALARAAAGSLAPGEPVAVAEEDVSVDTGADDDESPAALDTAGCSVVDVTDPALCPPPSPLSSTKTTTATATAATARIASTALRAPGRRAGRSAGGRVTGDEYS